MVDTIEKTLYPLFLATFILGCGIFRYPLGQLNYYLSIFYILTVWSVYACVFYYIKIQYSVSIIYNNLLSSFMTVTNLFVAMISIIITVRKHEVYFLCVYYHFNSVIPKTKQMTYNAIYLNFELVNFIITYLKM